MPEYITANSLYKLMENFPLIDVRSPAEFLNGHIPGAYNIPLFTNQERALVGTRFKKSGKDFAIELGLEIVGPKMLEFVRQAKKIAVDKTLIVHCWRGGMRSASMAWLFETAGLKVFLLEGGYKNYRHFNREKLGEAKKIIILSGYTGSGKTDVLKALQYKGEQIIDLEGLAHHKGSAFGAIGQEPQPSNEQFENNLTLEWSKLDLNKRIWIEDESITMGKNGIPDTLFNSMRKAPVIRIDIPQPVRAQRLVKEYACFGSAMLEKAIHRIETRLGPQNTKAALEALANNNYTEVASLTLSYYDKAYLKGLSKRNPASITNLPVSDDNPDSTAEKLIELADKR
jgi:tRNA 2-selenouridine synthase